MTRRALAPFLLSLVVARAMAQAGPPAQPRVAVFETEVTSVLVDVFVTDKDQNVRGLVAQDFLLKDNDVQKPFEIVPADSLPVRLILAFDTSSSVMGPKLDRLQAAARLLIDGLRPQDEAGLVSFSEKIVWRTPLSNDHATTRNAIGLLTPRGATAVYDGLFSALLLPRSALRTLVVLFSDGEDNTSWLSRVQIRRLVERFNALIYVVMARSEPAPSDLRSISLISDLYVRTLRDIAEVTGGSLIEAKSADKIGAAFAEIMERMKGRYVLRYDPEDAPAAGWHRLEITLKSKKGKVRGRSGYWVDTH